MRVVNSRKKMAKLIATCAALTAAATAPGAHAATAQRSELGKLADGRTVETITLANDAGVKARIITYGATLQSLEAPDRTGAAADIILGYDDLAGYVDKPNYFGVTVGRYANRIAGGRFALRSEEHTSELQSLM